MNWSSPEGGKGVIVLTFSDMAIGTIIEEPIQLEVYRESSLFGTFVVRDGLLIMNRIRRRKKTILHTYYYSYRFKIRTEKKLDLILHLNLNTNMMIPGYINQEEILLRTELYCVIPEFITYVSKKI